MMPSSKFTLVPLALFSLLLGLSVQAQETEDYCIPPDRLDGLVNQLKTSHPKLNKDSYFSSITMINTSSANIGKNLYNQVLEITFTDEKGQEFIVISQHKTTAENCKMLTNELTPFIGQR